jgi:phage shock protein PspC (stress-responsive transcriptional regulator)
MDHATSARRLVRVPAEGRIAGVCGGIAAYLDTDVTAVRLAWIILSIVPGGVVGGLAAYIAAWLIMPESTESASPLRKRLTRSSRDRKLGGVCGGLAEYFAVDSTAVRLLWAILTIVPGAIVLGLLAYAVAWFIMPAGPIESVAHAPSAA